MKAYKFVKWDVPELSELKESRIFKAIEAAEKGDLKPLKEMYVSCGASVNHLVKGYYLLSGWKFNISEFCKTYLVKIKYSNCYYEYKSPNKTCLRNVFGNQIEVILEVVNRKAIGGR